MDKTTSCVFHLNNRRVNRHLKIQFDGIDVKHSNFPKCLGVYLDRALTYKRNMESVKSKLKSRVNIIQKLAGTTWGCTAKTLKVTTQAMVLSVAEYCSPVWKNSCHVKMVDTEINKALRVICGAVHSTPIEWLHILSHIPPSYISRQEATLRECKKISEDTELPIHRDMMTAPIVPRLKSRKPLWEFYRTFDEMDVLKTR